MTKRPKWLIDKWTTRQYDEKSGRDEIFYFNSGQSENRNTTDKVSLLTFGKISLLTFGDSNQKPGPDNKEKSLLSSIVRSNIVPGDYVNMSRLLLYCIYDDTGEGGVYPEAIAISQDQKKTTLWKLITS